MERISQLGLGAAHERLWGPPEDGDDLQERKTSTPVSSAASTSGSSHTRHLPQISAPSQGASNGARALRAAASSVLPGSTFTAKGPGRKRTSTLALTTACLSLHVSASDAGWEPAFCDKSGQDESCGCFYRPAARSSSREDSMSWKPNRCLKTHQGRNCQRRRRQRPCRRLDLPRGYRRSSAEGCKYNWPLWKQDVVSGI
jgi:hypothetical protein